MNKCPIRSLLDVEKVLGPYKKSPSIKDVKKLCSREIIIDELSRKKPNKLIRIIEGILYPARHSDLKKVQMNYIRGELFSSWWNNSVIDKLSEDGIPILKKLNEEKKPISEHSIVDLVFDNETNKLFEEKLSFNLSNDNLEIKLEMAEFLYRYFKNNRYDEWGEKHIGNYENLSLGELSDEQLKFKFMSDYFDEFNRRNGIIIAGKKIPINLKRKNFFITPMYKLVQFSFLQYFRPLLEVDKKFSSEKMSLIMKNTYENLILASANREQRNAYYINTITSNEANGYYILDQNEMRIVEVPEMIKKYSFLPGKINELFREEYSRVRSGCPVRKMRGNHFGISLLKEMFLVETQIYSKIYERFYNS